jgi:hypothetical protein
MSFSHPFTPTVLGRCDLTSGSRAGTARRTFAGHCTPVINHVRPAFTQNKRYRTNPRAADGVVNRNAVSVYQTDAFLILY